MLTEQHHSEYSPTSRKENKQKDSSMNKFSNFTTQEFIPISVWFYSIRTSYPIFFIKAKQQQKVLKFRHQWLNSCLPYLEQKKTFNREWNTFICHEQHVCLLKFGARNRLEIFCSLARENKLEIDYFPWWKWLCLF